MIFVAVPAYGGVRPETVTSLVALMMELNEVMPGSSLNLLADNADLRHARSEQAGQFLDSKAEKLLLIDSDIAVSPETIARMHGTNADCVTLAYPMRKTSGFAIKLLDGVDHPSRSPTRTVGKERLIELDAAGLGCMLVQRHVVEAVRDRHPELMYVSEHLDQPVCMMFQPGLQEVQGVRRPLGEDFAFCHRVRAAGFKVECLVDAEVDHAGIRGNLRRFFSVVTDDRPTSPRGLPL